MPNSRISGACNGCRAKKQKCSGDRIVPVPSNPSNRAGTTSVGCYQCESAGVICTWPEQRKRGPAKGYIEGLEHRVHEAEKLLLRLLEMVDDQKLRVAVDENNTAAAAADNEDTTTANDNITANRDVERPKSAAGDSGFVRKSSPPILNKKTGIEYWENFPLDSLENIRRWQGDCALHTASSITSTSIGNNTAGTDDITGSKVQGQGVSAENNEDVVDNNDEEEENDHHNPQNPSGRTSNWSSNAAATAAAGNQHHQLAESFHSRQQVAANRVIKASALGARNLNHSRNGTRSSTSRISKGAANVNENAKQRKGEITGEIATTLTDEMERNLFW